VLNEANPPPEIIKNNILKSLEDLLVDSSYVPMEFNGDEIMHNAGSKANLEQALELISRAKQIDPDATRTAVNDLIEKHKEQMPELMRDSITSYMRLNF
jgi:hypothetical protein